MSKRVSRYQWPESREERLAVIEANLRVEIPERRSWSRRGKGSKEEIETEGEGEEGTDE